MADSSDDGTATHCGNDVVWCAPHCVYTNLDFRTWRRQYFFPFIMSALK